MFSVFIAVNIILFVMTLVELIMNVRSQQLKQHCFSLSDMDGSSSVAEPSNEKDKAPASENGDAKSRRMSLDEAREKAASRLSVS